MPTAIETAPFKVWEEQDIHALVAAGPDESLITAGLPATDIDVAQKYPDIGDGGQAMGRALLGPTSEIIVPELLVPTVEEYESLLTQDLATAEAQAVQAAAAPRLTGPQIVKQRDMVMQACALGVAHSSSIHYTEGNLRWTWHNPHIHLAWRGQYVLWYDCSAFSHYALFNAKHHYPPGHDNVSNSNWTGGYTGSMIHNGLRVHSNLQRGDQVLYGNPLGATGHVATYIGGGWVISHGSEIGPIKVSMHYRSDIYGFWRYIY